MRPVRRVAIAEPRAVATTTSDAGIPADAMICGLTRRMYEIVRKDERPARSSVGIVEPRSVILKYASREVEIVMVGGSLWDGWLLVGWGA
jgi:hypothetical protein